MPCTQHGAADSITSPPQVVTTTSTSAAGRTSLQSCWDCPSQLLYTVYSSALTHQLAGAAGGAVCEEGLCPHPGQPCHEEPWRYENHHLSELLG